MDIEKLDLDIIEMGKRIKESLNFAFSFYFNPNKEQANNIIDDHKINNLEREIENTCLVNILRERPFASDLRKLTGYFKVCEDLERLGDHAEDIFWVTTSLIKFKEEIRLEKLDMMINQTLNMLNKAIESLINLDDLKAKEVIDNDDLIDHLYLEILDELPKLKIEKNLDDEFIIYSTLLTKYVERIADHSSNVAEWAIYIKNGYYKDRYII